MSSKSDIRREVKQRLAALSDSDKQSASNQLCERLLQQTDCQAAQHIGVYFALPDEISLLPAIEIWLERGKQLATPVFLREEFQFRDFSDVRKTATGAYNIEEPIHTTAMAQPLDLILVPARAFTCQGARIGRGKGIYDRLLAKHQTMAIGVGFACQLFDTLPQDSHDQVLQAVFTSP